MRLRALVSANPASPALVGKMVTTMAVPNTTPTPIISSRTDSHRFTCRQPDLLGRRLEHEVILWLRQPRYDAG